MKKRSLLIVVGLITAALAPAVVVAGNGDTGACAVILAEEIKAPEGEEIGIVCANDLTFDECSFLCGEKTSPDGTLIVVDCDWLEGLTCEDVEDKTGEPWDGACEIFGIPDGGGLCIEIAETLPGWTSQEICEEGGGIWQGDGSTCNAPVPALPTAGQAALLVVLLLGTLMILKFSGIIRSGSLDTTRRS